MKPKTYPVPRADHGQTLQAFLTERLGCSRNEAKRLLDTRTVFVNGQRVWMARHTLAAGDQIEVPAAQEPAAPKAGASADRPRLSLLFQDAHYAVADKPAGLLSNGGADSVEQRLRRELNRPDLLAAHRLDRDTSGCLLLAFDREAFDAIVRLFKAKAVHKQYEALVLGAFPAALREFRQPVDGLPAHTVVRSVRAAAAASLLRLELLTGRTHQIRKHLEAAGFPLAGDKQYGTHQALPPVFRQIPRQMLHAVELAFEHPFTQQPVRAVAPRPPDFTKALKLLDLA